MARLPRIKGLDHIYSVVTRVNNSDFAFQDKSIAKGYIEHLKKLKEKLKFKLYGFVIMATHVHLLLQPDDSIADISAVMMEVNGKFSVKYNKHHKRKGHFWMGRFSSKVVQDARHIVNSIIYFALNPVRAGIVDNPLAYEFSSIQLYNKKLVNSKLHKELTELIDQLPEDLNEVIRDFLRRENYIILIEKLIRTAKKYSFNLSRKFPDQKYRHFCGNLNFLKLKLKQFNI